MDSIYIREGHLIDIIDKEWITDKVPNADVNVPLSELPDTELNEMNGHTTQTARELEMKWNESGLHQTWVIINS
jgi:anaphase-promoting complex subunit 13